MKYCEHNEPEGYCPFCARDELRKENEELKLKIISQNGKMQISKEEYLDLKLAAEKLSFLEAGGVDNWQWYSESLRPDGQESYWDLEERITKEVNAGGS